MFAWFSWYFLVDVLPIIGIIGVLAIVVFADSEEANGKTTKRLVVLMLLYIFAQSLIYSFL